MNDFRKIQLSPQHFIGICVHTCNKYQYQLQYVYAKQVRKHDMIIVVDDNDVKFVEVQRVWQSKEVGLFNPYVRGGDIIVNDIAASVHSEWILDDYPYLKTHWLPTIYEVLLTPIYALYKALGRELSEKLAERLNVHSSGSVRLFASEKVVTVMISMMAVGIIYFAKKKRV